MSALLAILVLTAHVATQGSVPSQTQQDQPITEISLEMVQGEIEIEKPLGRDFTIVLRRDGTAFFEGRANVKLLGKYRGTISETDFNRLSEFLLARRYERISDELPQRIRTPSIVFYDSPVVMTGVVRGGKQKKIRRQTIVTPQYMKSIPKEIKEIENAITEAAMKIKWAKVVD
jgi:hypothetical protein